MRAVRFLQRKLKSLTGPSVRSVQEMPLRKFLRVFSLASGSGSAALPGNGAVTTLLHHFGARMKEYWPAVPGVLTDLRVDLSEMSDEEIVARADSALSGDLHPSGLKPLLTTNGGIDWSSNPGNNREWLLMLHRHAWWPLWGVAYQRTGDEKYARAFVDQMIDWVDQHPLPARKAEHLEPWRLMETGLRLRVSWIPAFGCFFESPAFDDDAKLKMLRALYDHGQFLNQFHTNRNHLVRESNGLISLALCFPEFVKSKEWLERGLRRLDEGLQAQLNTDGTHIEMSVGYQWLTIDEFEVTRALLQKHGLTLPQSDLEGALHRMYEYLAAVIRPDRTFPQLNDGFILWDAARLQNAAAESGWQDLEYVGSGGSAGTQPGYFSRSFPNAGVHVMRSDWSENARYLIADTGPYGGPHGHEDKLSFELFAHGAPFIVDPGSYTYEKSDAYRNYFVGSQGHNTVMVDGKSQVRRWNKEHMTPQVQDGHHGFWRAGDEFDFASGRFDEGYAPFSLIRPNAARAEFGIIHQRDFIFARPEYWVLIDYLHASDVHNYQFLFHLAPDVDVEEITDSRVLLRSELNGARLIVQAVSHEALCSEVLVGSEAPIQGWYSADHHVKCPAPAIVFGARNLASVCVAWLLYPLAPGMSVSPVKVEQVENSDEEFLGFAVIRSAGTDSYSIQSNAAENAAQPGSISSKIAVARNGRTTWTTGSVDAEKQ